jgi:hypothetical protein
MKARAIAIVLCLSIVFASLNVGALARAGDDEKKEEPPRWSGFVTLETWDAEKGLGTFTGPGKRPLVVAVVEATAVRVDQPVPASRTDLLAEQAKEVWLLAEKQFVQTAHSVNVGYIRDRVVLAAGFAIEPLPSEPMHVPAAGLTLRWLHGTETDWKSGVTRLDFAPFEMRAGRDEVVLFAAKGGSEKIKRGRRLHLLGEVTGRCRLGRGGRVLADGEEEGGAEEALLVTASRVVVLHKAFAAVYPHCFPEAAPADGD